MRIEECIQYVLIEEQYVSLPGIGSFIREVKPSHIDSLQQIHPPQQSISFTSERLFDDGALVKYLLQHSTLTEEEVQNIVTHWLNLIRDQLNHGQLIYFQGIGTLKKEKEHLFFCADNSKLNLATPILGHLHLPKSKKKSRRKNRRITLGIVLGISLSIVILFLWLTYWLVSPNNPPKRNSTNTKERQEIPLTDSFNTLLPIADTSLLNKQTQQYLDSTHKQINALRVETESKNENRYVYYIIAGSFSNIENANTLMRELVQKGYNPEIRNISSMYRVTLGKFYDKKTGVKEVNKRRAELKDDSYWLIETIESAQ